MPLISRMCVLFVALVPNEACQSGKNHDKSFWNEPLAFPSQISLPFLSVRLRNILNNHYVWRPNLSNNTQILCKLTTLLYAQSISNQYHFLWWSMKDVSLFPRNSPVSLTFCDPIVVWNAIASVFYQRLFWYYCKRETAASTGS